MFVFSLSAEEAVAVGDEIIVKVLEIDGDEVQLEIYGPGNVPVEERETDWSSSRLEAAL